MPKNKNALIRYKTIDQCLQNTYRTWTLDDLIEACSQALYEYEGELDGISKRSIQLDIQLMRSEKLGYQAPIEVHGGKYYRYAEPGFSIKNTPINPSDLKIMNDAVQILKQFKDFSALLGMNGLIQKLEDSVAIHQTKAIIHLDKNERLKGLEYIDIIYQAIGQKHTLIIAYKPFKSHEIKHHIVHPQLLKEYNNRWFVIVWKKNGMLTLALDRIEEIKPSMEDYIDKNINADNYFSDIIGVTLSSDQKLKKVIFTVNPMHSPYIKTKPLHHSQILLDENIEGYCCFSIDVQLNFELERLILGFGDAMVIHQPKKLRESIKKNIKNAMKLY